MKIEKKNIRRWCKELRSGKYNQTTHNLQDKHGYCCLGVACKVFIPKDQLELHTYGSYISGGVPANQPYSPMWLMNIREDFSGKTDKLIDLLNDEEDFSFDEIADVLELVYIHEILD